MSCHAGGNITASPHGTGHRARRGVVNNWAVIQQTVLKLFCAFTDVVGQSCQFPVSVRPKCRRKTAAKLSRTRQMLGNRLIFLIVIGTFPFFMRFSSLFEILQFFRLERRISLVIIAVVDALHKNLAAVHFAGKSVFQQHLDLYVLNGAALHS